MRFPGLTMNDVWADRVCRTENVDLTRRENVPAEIAVMIQSTWLDHRGPQENFRPYMHARGELRLVTPAAELPHQITEVFYSPGQGQNVDAFYEFTDDQLARLVQAGYFQPGFDVPDRLTSIEWELPAKTDALILAPSAQAKQKEDPVIFLRVHDLGNLEVDLRTCGYDMAEEIITNRDLAPTPAIETATPHGPAPVVQGRRSDFDPIFTADEIGSRSDLHLAVTYQDRGQDVQAEQEALSPLRARLHAEAEALAAEREEMAAERARRSGSVENTYATRVAPVLEDEEQESEEEFVESWYEVGEDGLPVVPEEAIEAELAWFEEATTSSTPATTPTPTRSADTSTSAEKGRSTPTFTTIEQEQDEDEVELGG